MVRYENFKQECPLCKKHCIVTSREQHAIELIHNMDCRTNNDIENLINPLQNQSTVSFHNTPTPTTTLFGIPMPRINVQSNLTRNSPPPPPLVRRRRIIQGNMTTQDILMDQQQNPESIFENAADIILDRY